MNQLSVRSRLLALLAPGAIGLDAGAVDWAVEGSTEIVRPPLSTTAPGCSPARVGRLVADEPGRGGHFSTKARSIT